MYNTDLGENKVVGVELPVAETLFGFCTVIILVSILFVIRPKFVFQHDLLQVVKKHANIHPVEACGTCQACGLW